METAHKLAIGQLESEVFTRPEQRAGLFLGYVLYGIYAVLFWVILPPYPVPVPLSEMNLVLTFRWLSALGVALFWMLMGTFFFLFWQRNLASQEHKRQGQKRRHLLAQ